MPDRRRPDEIEARPFKDYRPTPQKGEPCMAPGGWWLLAATVAGVIYWQLGATYIKPIVRQWVETLTGQ